MSQIETNQITFGKATQRLIAEVVKGARSFKAIGKDYLIKDAEGKTVATWHKRSFKKGLIVIH